MLSYTICINNGMSSFDHLVKRVQMLTEAKAAGYAKQAPVFKDVPKQMKAAGMAASSRDAMLFILQVLSRLDIITPEAHDFAKKGQHKERMEKLMQILKGKEDEINAKEKEIVEFINSNLDNYTAAAGSDRNRVEKYKETAKKISKEVSNIAAGKEADDGLRDILHFVNDTMQDMNIQKDESDTAETGPVVAAVDATMAQLRKLHQEDPEDIPPYVIEDLEEITPKIERMDQLDSFIKQLAAFTKEDQYYEKPVIYFMDAAKKAKQVAAEDGEMINTDDIDEDTISDLAAIDHALGEGATVADLVRDYGSELVKQYIDYKTHPARQEDAEDGEHLPAEGGETFETFLKDMFAQQYDSDPEEFENFIDDIHDALGQQKEYDLGKGSGLTEPLEWRMEMGMDLDTAIEDAQESLASLTVSDVVTAEDGEGKYDDGDGKDEKCDYVPCEDGEHCAGCEHCTPEEEKEEEEDEEVVTESKYTTADYLTDIYSTVKPIVESTVNENGQTTPTVQYIAERAEEAIEEIYTANYLAEQKASDSLLVPKTEKRESFKERFQPKTSYQLEELRRYGL